MRYAAACALALTIGLGESAPAHAKADCVAEGAGVGDYLEIVGTCVTDATEGSPGLQAPGSNATQSPYRAYRWASVCLPDPMVTPSALDCAAALTCAEPRDRVWQLWGQLANGTWRTIRTQCFGGTPPEVQPPEVTAGDVLSALRRVGLPALETFVQPRDKTLVNFDTIFYTQPQPVDFDLTILGQAVGVEATAASYRWVFGDGSELTTQSPGGPFPDKTVTHRYADAQVTVLPHVEVTYSAAFQVNGGGWQDISETITTVGPSTELRVAEGDPLLSGDHS